MFKRISSFQVLILVVFFAFVAFVTPPLNIQASAFDFSKMNPINLLMTEEEAAVKKAKEAEKAAEEAELRAKEAVREAERARKLAEIEAQKAAILAEQKAKQEETTDTENNDKPVVNFEVAEKEAAGKGQVAQQSVAATQENLTQENFEAKQEKSVWNPMRWFDSDKDKSDKKDEKKAVKEAPVAKKEAKPEVKPNELPRLPIETIAKENAAVLETEKGKIAIELYPDAAPLTVANFIKLVNAGFYNQSNMKFHRVVPGFVVQTGDPTGTGAGGSKDRVPLEVKNKLSHDTKGVVAMARSYDPDSATSQFYITLAPQTQLDGKYAIFGRVIGGSDVLDKIEKDTKLYGVKLVEMSKIARDPVQKETSLLKKWLP